MNTFARIESACTFRDGLSFLIKSISFIRQIELLNATTKNQLFQFNGNLEDKLDQDGKLPSYYRRYVDDTFTTMPDIASAEIFLDTLNHCHPSAKFTVEVERNASAFYVNIRSIHPIPEIAFYGNSCTKIFLSHRSVNESIFLSRVEGSMSRVRVPCRGSRVTFFFSKLFFFFEKVIIDSINVIKTNKKDFAGGEGGGGGGIEKSSGTSIKKM